MNINTLVSVKENFVVDVLFSWSTEPVQNKRLVTVSGTILSDRRHNPSSGRVVQADLQPVGDFRFRGTWRQWRTLVWSEGQRPARSIVSQ